MNQICIVGMDTGIGKTYVCCQILNYLTKHSRNVLALKPISCGKINTCYGEINQDVYKLYLASNIKLSFNQINPFAFNHAVAPHIAAKIENIELNLDSILVKTRQIINAIDCDYILIEGVGGLMVPLNMQDTYLDLLVTWEYPVIMVVGMKLGCLNHALLTKDGLINAGINVLGWIANCIDEKMDAQTDNLEYLKVRLDVPLLATIRFAGNIRPTKEFLGVFK